MRIVKDTIAPPNIDFSILANPSDSDLAPPTVTLGKARCLCCGSVLPRERIRAQLIEKKGGANPVFDSKGNRVAGARLLAVVTLNPSASGRSYRLPTGSDYALAYSAQERLKTLLKKAGEDRFPIIPTEEIVQERVAKNSPFRLHLYGYDTFGELSNQRQQLLLVTLQKIIRERAKETQAIEAIMALLVSRIANASTVACRWNRVGEKIEGMFTRQAISMVWDYCEGAPFSGATGSIEGALQWILSVAATTSSSILLPGQTEHASAVSSPLSDESTSIWMTDPPYYDAVSYADLSDFFYVWLKRSMNESNLRLVRTGGDTLTPKEEEIIQDDARRVNGKPKDKRFFEDSMGQAFGEGRRILKEDGVGCVVFAHKSTEGWEALLTGMIRGGWTITGSWPIATEMSSRLRARESAALATSVHLVCRPRPEDAPVGDWGQVLKELPKRVGDWMERLQSEGVRGADLVFACIGPALEIFSRYTSVETAEGREVKLAEYLEKVWEVVGREALEQILGTAEAKARNGAAGALEEDARLTALFLWTLQSTAPTSGKGSEEEPSPSGKGQGEDEDEGLEEDDDEDSGSSKTKAKGFTLVFDVVRRFAQPLGINLPKWEDRVIKTEKGVVRLLPLSERAKPLFGEEGAQAVADYLETSPDIGPKQLTLFGLSEAPKPKPKRRGKAASASVTDEDLAAPQEATTLDRIHMAMLLQRGGKTNALRNLLKSEQERGPEFLRLANALSALYPKGSEEKRLLDAMLLAAPR